MKLLSKEHVYKNDWETVTSAWWVKYPNADQPHVVNCQTVARTIDKEAKTFNVRRIFEIDWALPWIGQKLMQTKSVQGLAVEDISCDLNAKRMVIEGRNHSMSRFFAFDECCVYEQHPTNPAWTVFRQSTKVRIVGTGDWLSKGIARMQTQSASAGIGVMERMIKKMEETNWKSKAYLWDNELKALLARKTSSFAAKLQERVVYCEPNQGAPQVDRDSRL